MKRTFIRCLLFVLTLLFYSACSEDPMPEPPAPMVNNIELGLGDSGIAVIGQDFHFNADVIAGDKIDTVEIIIRQKGAENYTADWSMSLIWDQYRGLKNTNIHKHFDIPEDAVEGIYDFVVLVKDQNGGITEIVRTLSIDQDETLLN